MPEINANFVIQPVELTTVVESTDISFTPSAVNLTIAAGGIGIPGGSNTQLQFNSNGALGGIPVATWNGSNLSLGDISNVKITGGSSAYYLQTDGSGNLTWAAGTSNVTGNGSSAGSNNAIQIGDGTGNFVAAPGFNFNSDSNLFSTPGAIDLAGPLTFANNKIRINTNSAVGYGTSQLTIGVLGNAVGNAVASIGIGFIANRSLGANSIAIGLDAGAQGINSIAIGREAGGINQNVTQAVLVGMKAGYYGDQTVGAESGPIAIGYQAGSRQQSRTVAIGWQAAGNTTPGTLQKEGAIAIGSSAASTNQGIGAVAIGSSAGLTTQGNTSVAIGSFAAANTQGANAVAIGYEAGNDQQGIGAVAIGVTAGVLSQGVNAIAIGSNAGPNTQGTGAIAIGNNAGGWGGGGPGGQGNYAISIGDNAGRYGQGSNSIAIGRLAGNIDQANNSIVINATGANLDAATANSLFIKPIRTVNSTAGLNQLYYDSSTGEIVVYVP